MRLFKNDHPRLYGPDCLSCDEIRFYLEQLIRNPDFGWSHAYQALEVAFGMSNPGKQWLKTKIKRSWIYPGEQIRFTKVIREILAGELVPKLLPDGRKGRMVWMPARAADPKPIKAAQKGCWKVNLESGRVSFSRPPVTFAPGVPAFSTWLRDPKEWIPPREKKALKCP
jgi:hypothetical protein